MRPGGGKAKGSAFERQQAKIISLWVSNDKDCDLFWRSSNSGGRASQGQVTGTQYGDLTIQKPTKEAQQFYSTFSVELKRYKKFDVLKGWLNPKSDLRDWWGQCKEEADKNKVYPMLIVKPDRGETFIILDMLVTRNINNPASGFIEIYNTNPLFNIKMFKQEDFIKSNIWKSLYKEIKIHVDFT